MSEFSLNNRGWTTAGFAIAGMIVSIALLAGSPATASAACSNGNAPTSTLSKGQASDAMICLLNGKRGASNLEKNSDLGEAAQKHTNVMRSKECFSHRCSGEKSLLGRVKDTGYFGRSGSGAVGEIIAINGPRATPKDILRSWLDSSAHRNIIGDSVYDNAGVGISGSGQNVLYTVVFGGR